MQKRVIDARVAESNALRCEAEALAAESMADRLTKEGGWSPASSSLIALEGSIFRMTSLEYQARAKRWRDLAAAIREATGGRDTLAEPEPFPVPDWLAPIGTKAVP
jgi:hypothetical protein